jgi:hypothetical protein
MSVLGMTVGGWALFLITMANALAQTDSFAGTYRIDPNPSGTSYPPAIRIIEEQQAAGATPIFKIGVAPAGTWQVEPAFTGGGLLQTLASRTWEGFPCLEAMFVLVCKVPKGTHYTLGPGASFRSRTGLIIVATHIGILDLIEVSDK